MNATNPALAALTTRIDLIEEAYEYMLAYAAQGFEKDTDSHGPSIRDCLSRFERALGELEQPARALLGSSNAGFAEVLTRDASATIAAFKLVLSCRTISSQLIDNLNGSVHLRALLTDLFVIDEYLKITYGIVAEPIGENPPVPC